MSKTNFITDMVILRGYFSIIVIGLKSGQHDTFALHQIMVTGVTEEISNRG